jgi:tetratricopeptide (TPR) repeat protein
MATNARLDELKKKFDENPRRYFAPLANEYRKQGDATQAIALCRTHLPNQPGHISGHIVLAQALYESRELGESRQVFEAALELDPENLIALRYLGDIAREQGAPRDAQAWYRRVLEFDPRNDEIAQLLADVSQEAETALADLASRPTPPTGGNIIDLPEEQAPAAVEETPAPVEAMAAEPAAVPVPDETVDLYDSDPTGDSWRETMAKRVLPEGEMLDISDLALNSDSHPADIGELAAAPEASHDDWFSPPAPVDAPVAGETVSAAEPETLPVETTDSSDAFSWEPATAEAERDDAVEAPAMSAEATTEGLLDFSDWALPNAQPAESSAHPKELAEATTEEWSAPPSLAAASEEPAVSSGASEDLPIEADQAPPALVTADAESDVALHQVDLMPDGEMDAARAPEPITPQLIEPDVTEAEPASEEISASGPEEEPADEEEAAISGGSDPLIGRTPSFVQAVSEETPAPFVTETMAELYLQQGFHDEALSVYRQLLARDPNDSALADRVRALESGAASSVVPDTVVLMPASPASESARSFFARFANRGARAQTGATDTQANAPTVPMAGAALPDEAMTSPDAPTLTHMFSGRDVPDRDVRAASALASAFGPASESPSGELSLERLFRDVPAGSPGAVTLGDMGTHSSSPKPEAATPAEGEAPADYEQFTAWLEGLKKK